MVEECIHVFPDGRKCRRIPKRGHRFCPAHRPHRGRTPLENEAFHREMFAFCDRLQALSLPALLAETNGALADIQGVIERYASRRHRLAFTRATIAVTMACDRVAETAQSLRQRPAAPPPAPQPPLGPPLSSQELSPEALARIREAESVLSNGPLTPEQLDQICGDLLSTLNADTRTNSIADSNT
ncbi:MAG TPA: hypothetical protein VL990_06710 [Acidobacteriaceae bacterium]|nr:hypothetical protein [Acidobacteriaceae bacterium]